MKKIKAIQTVYNGYKFRSRLEARWAVCFDHLGLRWEYETEGYELPTGWYLPDFFFPDFNVFAEIKAEVPDHDGREHKLLQDLSVATEGACFAFGGDPLNMMSGEPPYGHTWALASGHPIVNGRTVVIAFRAALQIGSFGIESDHSHAYENFMLNLALASVAATKEGVDMSDVPAAIEAISQIAFEGIPYSVEDHKDEVEEVLANIKEVFPEDAKALKGVLSGMVFMNRLSGRKFLDAAKAARRARFEHGERG